MKKRNLFILITFLLVFISSACGKETTDGISDSESRPAYTDNSGSVSGEEPLASDTDKSVQSEDDISTVFSDIFKGDGYSLGIPEGFTFYDEVNGVATFTTKEGSQLSVTKEKNNDKISTMTQGQNWQRFSAIYGEIEFTEFVDLKIEGKSRIYFVFPMEADGVTVIVYNTVIFTDDDVFTITMEAFDVDYSDVYYDMMGTFKTDD